MNRRRVLERAAEGKSAVVDVEQIDTWQELARQLRVDSTRASSAAGSGHPTSSLAAADLLEAEDRWLRKMRAAVEAGIPAPALSASRAYFDSYRTATLLQNLTLAQRDVFRAHTYQRSGRPEAGFFRTDWQRLTSEPDKGPRL